MDSLRILESNDSQRSPFHFRNDSPESDPSVGLNFPPERLSYDPFAPLS